MYLPHARYALESELGEGAGSKKTELLWKFGLCVYSDGRYTEAEKSFAQVIQTRNKVLGDISKYTLNFLLLQRRLCQGPTDEDLISDSNGTVEHIKTERR